MMNRIYKSSCEVNSAWIITCCWNGENSNKKGDENSAADECRGQKHK